MNESETPTGIPALEGDEREIVESYLAKNANDAEGLEFVEWSEPRLVTILPPGTESDRLEAAAEDAKEVKAGRNAPLKTDDPIFKPEYKPGVIMQLKWRGKNPLGAKVLRDDYFLVQDGKVTNTSPVATGLSYVGEIATEKLGGKVTKILLRGQLKHEGRQVAMTKDRFSEGIRLWLAQGDFQTWNAYVIPPYFEIPGVPPGQYRVAAEWWESGNARPGTGAAGGRVDKLGGRYSPERTPLVCVVGGQQEIRNEDFGLTGELQIPNFAPGSPFDRVVLPRN